MRPGYVSFGTKHQTKFVVEMSNSVDPDETAHDMPSHQDLAV